MADRQDGHSSLEVHHEPPIVARSNSPFPEEPVFVPTESPQAQLSPSLPDRSFRDSDTTKCVRDSGATKLEYPPDFDEEETRPKAKQLICGLQPITFWILVALIFILCAAAIGGGVGGSFATEANKSAAETPSSASGNGAASRSKNVTSPTPKPNIITETTTAIPSSTSYISAPNPVPTENADTHLPSFKLTVHDMNSDQTETGDLPCGYAGGPCQFSLDSSRLYGWSSQKLQYIDCNGQFILNANTVNQSCLSFDAGFSFSSSKYYFFHGSGASWWLCSEGWFIMNKGDDCEEKTWWVTGTNLS